MHTVDQLNLATAKFSHLDLAILNILVTAEKMANFGLSGKLIVSFFSRPFGGNHISNTHRYSPAITKSKPD